MQCAHCATPVPDTAKYCQNCGSLVSDAEGQAAATAAMDASAFAQMEQLLREDTKGEFEILRPLGRGGMAMVYLGREIHLARHVAIKVLPPELTFGHGVERFKREAKTAAALDHPNIIPIYRVASGGKIFWYAMKYLEGRSLEELLKQKQRLSINETIDILTKVADALDYAHEHKVIHRDIKPANVMLDARNRVVVTDFGIAKALTEGTLTASGSVVGTPYFMSPEQGMGKAIGGASDQYSVAVMAYRMLSGHVPFEGESAIEILHKHCTEPAPPLEVIGGTLPPHTAWAIHKALDKNPDRRFPSVKAFVEALREATPEYLAADSATTVIRRVSAPPSKSSPAKAKSPPPVSPAPARASAPATTKKSKWKPLAAVVGGLAIVGGAAAVLLRPSPTPTPARDNAPPVAPPVAAPVPPPAPAETVATIVRAPVAPPAPAAPPPARPPVPGRVVVSGVPAGGTLSVDGRVQRASSFELPPGRHEVRIDARGYEPFIQSVMVVAGAQLRVPFAGKAARAVAIVPAPTPPPAPPPAAPPSPEAGALSIVRVSVSPAATVFVDGVDRGKKSRFEETVVPGTHTLRFTREGYVTRDTTITLAPGATLLLRIELLEGSP